MPAALPAMIVLLCNLQISALRRPKPVAVFISYFILPSITGTSVFYHVVGPLKGGEHLAGE